MTHPFPHSMALLKTMVTGLPPLVPERATQSAQETYDRLLRVPPTHANEIEDAIIAYGRVLWPYRKAFDALVRDELVRNEESHFVSRLTQTLRERFREWRKDGGSLTDLLDQRGVSSRFTPTERSELCEALIAARTSGEEAARNVIATNSEEYQRRIRAFQALQHELEQHIADLRRLAERASDHREVFAEIMETVRMFERGLANLAREPGTKEVCAAIEAYRERHTYLVGQREGDARPKIFR